MPWFSSLPRGHESVHKKAEEQYVLFKPGDLVVFKEPLEKLETSLWPPGCHTVAYVDANDGSVFEYGGTRFSRSTTNMAEHPQSLRLKGQNEVNPRSCWSGAHFLRVYDVFATEDPAVWSVLTELAYEFWRATQRGDRELAQNLAHRALTLKGAAET